MRVRTRVLTGITRGPMGKTDEQDTDREAAGRQAASLHDRDQAAGGSPMGVAHFVWDGERARIAEADEAAATLFGETGVLDLVERPFAPDGALARALDRLMISVAARPDMEDGLEGRLPHPMNGGTLTVRARQHALPDGRIGLAVEVLAKAEPDNRGIRLAALGEAIAAPGALFAADGEWLAGNDAALALLGDVTPPLATLLGDPGAATRLTGQALADGLASAIFRIATRFGARLARVTLTRARDPKTGGAAVAAYFNDIADRARLLAVPRPAAPLAGDSRATEPASATKEARALMSRVGHELRTPLNAILGFSEVMAREEFGPMGNAKYLEYARDIHTGGEHLLGLVDDLLEMARSENGRRQLNFEAVNTGELVQAMSDLLREEAAGRGLTLFAEIGGNLPPVVADARTLRQVLINLIGNAIKFTPSGGTVTIGTSGTEDGGVTLFVSDTGIGMSAEDLAAAMEPFGQVEAAQEGLTRSAPADTATGAGRGLERGLDRGLGRGLGLGLPLARALTEANKASFEIDSAPGEGTRARVIFPPTGVLAT